MGRTQVGGHASPELWRTRQFFDNLRSPANACLHGSALPNAGMTARGPAYARANRMFKLGIEGFVHR